MRQNFASLVLIQIAFGNLFYPQYVGGEKVDSVIINARKNYLWKLNREMEGEKCLEFSLEKW